MTNDVFEDNNTTTNNPSPAEGTDQYQELLSAIKREDGSPKYQSVEDAIKALAVSQEHIARLESENAQYRQSTERLDSMEQLLGKLQNQQPDQPVTKQQEQTNPNTLTEDQIAEIAARQFNNLKTQEQLNHNRNAFNQALADKFGPKAKEEFEAALQRTGLSKDIVATMVKQDPLLAVRQLGLDKPVNSAPSPRSTVSSGALNVNDDLPKMEPGKSKKQLFQEIAEYVKGQNR